MDFINQRLESKSLEKLSRPILGILSNIFMSFLKSEDVTEKKLFINHSNHPAGGEPLLRHSRRSNPSVLSLVRRR